MPDTVSAALGAFAAPLTLEHGGRTYKASALTQAKKTAVERWLVSRAKLLVGEEGLEAIARQAAKGTYRWGGLVCFEALQTPDGSTFLASLAFGIDAAEADALQDARPEETGAILAQVILESLPRKVREKALAAMEKAKAEASEEAPLPPSQG